MCMKLLLLLLLVIKCYLHFPEYNYYHHICFIVLVFASSAPKRVFCVISCDVYIVLSMQQFIFCYLTECQNERNI